MLEQLQTLLSGFFGDRITSAIVANGEITLEVPVAGAIEVLRQLRNHEDFHFEQLIE